VVCSCKRRLSNASGDEENCKRTARRLKGWDRRSPHSLTRPHAAEFAAKPNIIRTIMVGWVHIKTGNDLQQQMRLRWLLQGGNLTTETDMQDVATIATLIESGKC
jgi:hypothetical protein